MTDTTADRAKEPAPHVASDLASGYSARFRTLEIVGLGVYLIFASLIFGQLREAAPTIERASWLALAAALTGWLAADLVSGLAHWAGDTWGTPQWPIVGPTLIRTFREHHLDEKAITRHDFVETNGTNSLLTLPLFAGAWMTPIPEGGAWTFFGIASLYSMNLWVFATNQIHSWAHQDRVPRWVAWLQRARLILSPEHHAIHHRAPFDKYYCITTGWMNPLLHTTGFFRHSEKLISAVTGAVPRENDIY
jgi:ubiquitin-conjugating enzyme E2 variant